MGWNVYVCIHCCYRCRYHCRCYCLVYSNQTRHPLSIHTHPQHIYTTCECEHATVFHLRLCMRINKPILHAESIATWTHTFALARTKHIHTRKRWQRINTDHIKLSSPSTSPPSKATRMEFQVSAKIHNGWSKTLNFFAAFPFNFRSKRNFFSPDSRLSLA